MPNTNDFLDYAGLGRYHTKVQAELDKKVNAEAGKGLSENNFTTEEKNKLAGLSVYTLPSTGEETLGGVKISTSTDPVPTNTALKADATGTAYVDWAEAPQASATQAGILKLGGSLKQNEDGTVDVDTEHVGSHDVSWSDIKDKPDLALKTDITSVYKFKGNVATYDDLPSAGTEGLEVGDVYNVEATGMNWGWTGTVWDALGEIFEISRITDEQIDALFAADEET